MSAETGEFSVSDYAIFDDALLTANTFNNKIDSLNESVTNFKNIISDDSIFMGPISDACEENFNELSPNLDSNLEMLKRVSSSFQAVSDDYKAGDVEACKIILNSDWGEKTGSKELISTKTSDGQIITNNGVIDTSIPVEIGEKYNLSDEELAQLAYVAYREQGSVEGAKIELSLMANLYEKNKSNYSSVLDYVNHSGWFAAGATSGYYYPGDEYVNVAREVLNDGNRYLTSNVVEHDCLSDISYTSTGGSYIPGETIIHNVYGASYVFVGFAPNGGDPFGYLI